MTICEKEVWKSSNEHARIEGTQVGLSGFHFAWCVWCVRQGYRRIGKIEGIFEVTLQQREESKGGRNFKER